jgi:hypothetical protein
MHSDQKVVAGTKNKLSEIEFSESGVSQSKELRESTACVFKFLLKNSYLNE